MFSIIKSGADMMDQVFGYALGEEWTAPGLFSPYKNTLKTEFMCASWNNGSVDEVLKTYAAVIAAKGWGQYLDFGGAH